MQIIRFTYRRKDISPSIDIMFFFRLIGLYVFENFLDQPVELDEEIDKIRKKYPEVKGKENFNFDVELSFVSSEADFETVNKMNQNKENVIIVAKGISLQQNDTIIEYSDEKNVLKSILVEMYNKNLLDSNEYDDCCLVAELYEAQEFKITTLQSKYFFVLDDDSWYTKQKEKYWNFGKALLEKYTKLDSDTGSHCYVQYAIANSCYEANLYAKRNAKSYIFNCNACMYMIRKVDDSTRYIFNASSKMLIGQLYELLGEPHKAYENYLRCCGNNEENYNAYVFFLKGRYWQDAVGDYQMANKYYLKSVLIFPEYYRAWYKMGYCYHAMGCSDEAFAAFDAVRKILTNRLELGVIRPVEMEHLFLAGEQCAGILIKERDDFQTAIKYNKIAENVWNGIESNKFLKEMKGESENRLVNETKKNLDIKRIYYNLAQLYNVIGDIDNASDYEKRVKEQEEQGE